MNTVHLRRFQPRKPLCLVIAGICVATALAIYIGDFTRLELHR